ncbi:Transcription initiation factor TFIID subunit 6 [Smittium mucronatum]|uniref:Transcription initiation factor TFIID subunit 6 n=1 Tax=Smittium mucronatum TaxID=133383 RepID=A0A1R0GNQ7_9FUNG|nr:Transcription initiation factor TFIID subunit 6 [Smittium mucronatum]
MPSLLTCLLGKKLCKDHSENHWELRDLSASLIGQVVKDYGMSYHTLLQRLARTFLRTLLDPSKPSESHYGAIKGLFILGQETVRVLLLPNVKAFSALTQVELGSSDQVVVESARMCLTTLSQLMCDYAKSMKSQDPSQNTNSVNNSDSDVSKLRSEYGKFVSDYIVSQPDFSQWCNYLIN